MSTPSRWRGNVVVYKCCFFLENEPLSCLEWLSEPRTTTEQQQIVKIEYFTRTPSCCQTFDISLHWGILFKGSVDGEYCSVYNALKYYIWQSNSMLNWVDYKLYALCVFWLSRNTGEEGTLGGRWRAKLHIIKHYQNWTLGTYKIFYSVTNFVIVSSLSGDKHLLFLFFWRSVPFVLVRGVFLST